MERTVQINISVIHRHSKKEPLHGHSLKCEFIFRQDPTQPPIPDANFAAFVVRTVQNYSGRFYLHHDDPMAKTLKKRNAAVIFLDKYPTLDVLALFLMMETGVFAITIDDHMGKQVSMSIMDRDVLLHHAQANEDAKKQEADQEKESKEEKGSAAE